VSVQRLCEQASKGCPRGVARLDNARLTDGHRGAHSGKKRGKRSRGYGAALDVYLGQKGIKKKTQQKA
jgi:hypothetical protein